MISSLPLKSGNQIPQLGLGTWKIENAKAASVVQDAVLQGYRHFDCACDYGNEAEVGQGLAAALQSNACQREDLWITSKLWNTFHRPEHVRAACERSLQDLQTDYVDLYLVHFPISQRYVSPALRYPPGWFADPDDAEPRIQLDPVPIADTWGAMQELKSAGLAQEIGVCNFGTALLTDLMAAADQPPSVLQIELHPYLAQEKLLRFCREQDIAVAAFSPFGPQSYHAINMADANDCIFDLDIVQHIAAATGKTPAQVLLRWGVQRNTAVIPKTSQPARLRENLGIFDFTLNSDQMQALDQLDQHRRYNDPGDFAEKAFNTFLPIYE